jgi:hypothetical protein
MATKQATHLQPTNCSSLKIICNEWGGYLVMSHCDYEGRMREAAAFTTADECADWLRGFLRNRAAEKFGARKSEGK